MKKVLITGSEGFIGRYLTRRLRHKSELDVWTLDVEEGGKKHIQKPVSAFHEFNKFDEIYHLAAISNPRHCRENTTKCMDVNVKATQHIVEQLQSSQTIIFPSSCHVYNDVSAYKKTEGEELQPSSFYGTTKELSEEVIESSAARKEFEYIILRLFNTYGPQQPSGFLVPDVIEKAKNQEIVTVEDPNSKISPVYITDVVDVMESTLPGGIYNVCHECKEIREIYQQIASTHRTELKEPDRPRNPSYRCGDGSKIVKYKEEWISLEEGIRKVTEEKTSV